MAIIKATEEELLDKLLFKEFDAVITDIGMIDASLIDLDKVEFPVVLTCSKNLMMYKDYIKKPEILKNFFNDENVQWIIPSHENKFRKEIDKFFDQNNVSRKVAFESNSNDSLVHAVIDEIGIAFFPVIYVSQLIRQNILQMIGHKDGYWKYRVSLTCHEQNRNDQLIQQLSNSFKEVCSKGLVVA